MSITIEQITPQTVLALAQQLSPEDQRWLLQTLDQLLDDTLPESTTVDEAVELYLADKCSLGRAAELAGVTQWELRDVLKERGIPIVVYSYRSADEIDTLAEQLQREGIL